MQFELAQPADEPDLRRLLRRVPFAGDIRVSLEREPCIHHANAIEGERTQILVARPAPGAPIVGMATRTLLDCHVNGEVRRIGYLGQLRIAPEYQARPRLLQRGYARIRALHDDGAVSFYVTTIVSDNEPARRALEAGLPGLPRYQPVDELLTLVLRCRTLRKGVATDARRTAPTKATLSRAHEQDLDEIVACLARYGQRHQFTPVWRREDLLSPTRARGLRVQDFLLARRGGRVIGCLACWDQREFKQAVVRGYSSRLACVRPLSNLLAGITGAPRLPALGQPLASAFLSHLAVDDDDPRTLHALVLAALDTAARRGLDYATIGLSARNPLSTALQERLHARRYPSQVYLAYWPDGEHAARGLDARPTHLEVAIL